MRSHPVTRTPLNSYRSPITGRRLSSHPPLASRAILKYIPSMSSPITVTPIDGMRCRFTVGDPLVEAGVHHFTSCEEAKGVPVAEAVLGVPGIAEVVVSDRTITVES